MKPGAGSSKKINKVDKPLSRLIEQKRTQINKITDERGEITTNTTKMQMTIRKYC